MNFAAVHIAHLREGVGLRAAPYALGVWTRVLAYASEIEKDRIPAKDWNDAEWRASANVTRKGVASAVAAGLLRWDGDILVVHGFDHRGLAKVKIKRRNGKFGYLGADHGIKGGRPKKKNPPETDLSLRLPFTRDPDPESARGEDEQSEEPEAETGPEAWTHPDVDPDFDYAEGAPRSIVRAQEQGRSPGSPRPQAEGENARQRARAAGVGADEGEDQAAPPSSPPETSRIATRPQAIAGAVHRVPPEPVVGVSRAPVSPLTGHRLLQIFAKVRADMDETKLPWTIPPATPEKAARMAEAIAEDGAAQSDIEPTIRRLFEKAEKQQIRRHEEILASPAFAFGVWCVEFTPLREELRAGGTGRRPSRYQDL